MDDIGLHLGVHQAPENLLKNALLARRNRRGDQARMWAMAAAFTLAAAASLGWATSVSVGTDLLAENSEPVPVRLMLRAPDATSVAVTGSFNEWDPENLELTRGEDGLFYIVVLLPRGRHEYMFVVDGSEWVTDPAAPLNSDDDFGRPNAILDV